MVWIVVGVIFVGLVIWVVWSLFMDLQAPINPGGEEVKDDARGKTEKRD